MTFIIHQNLGKTFMERSRPVKLCIYDNIEVVGSITIKTIFLKHPQSFSIFLHYGILANFISYHNRIPCYVSGTTFAPRTSNGNIISYK